MGLMAADLERHRSKIISKTASESRPLQVQKQDILNYLEMNLDRYAGAATTLDKSASDEAHQKMWVCHENVEKDYREAVRIGKRAEANKLIDKYAGWAYLKGQPGEPGDMHPFPAPDEK